MGSYSQNYNSNYQTYSRSSEGESGVYASAFGVYSFPTPKDLTPFSFETVSPISAYGSFYIFLGPSASGASAWGNLFIDRVSMSVAEAPIPGAFGASCFS